LRAVAESVSTRPPAAATPAGGRLRIGSRLRRPPTWPWSRCWTRRADAVPPALRTGQGHPAPGSRGLGDWAGAGPGAAGAATPVGDRAVHRARPGPVGAGPPDAAHEAAVHRPRRGTPHGPGGCPAAARTSQGPRTARRRSAGS